MLAPLGYERHPLTPDWIDWNAPVGVDWDLAKELEVVGWWPGFPIGGRVLYDLVGGNDASWGGTTIGTALFSTGWTYGPTQGSPALEYNNAQSNGFWGLARNIDLTTYTAHCFVRRRTSSPGGYKFAFSADAGAGNPLLGFTLNSWSQTYLRAANSATVQNPSIPSGEFLLNDWRQFTVSRDTNVSGTVYSGGQSVSFSPGSLNPFTFKRFMNSYADTHNLFGDQADTVISSKYMSQSEANILANPFALAWQPSTLSMFFGDLGTSFPESGDETFTVAGVDDDAQWQFNLTAGTTNSIDFDAVYMGATTFNGEGPDIADGFLIRFDLTIPEGATISSATLGFTNQYSGTATRLYLQVADDADFDWNNPAYENDWGMGDIFDAAMITFLGGENCFGNRSNDTEDAASTFVLDGSATVSLADLIQSVVNKSGFSGSLLIRGWCGTSTSPYYTAGNFWSYDGDPLEAATLNVVWGGSDPTEDSVSEGAVSGDANVATVMALSLIAEGGVSGDANINGITCYSSVSEDGVSGDANINGITCYSSVSEDGVSGDVNINGITCYSSVSEGGVASETFTRALSFFVSTSEGSVSSEAFVSALTFFDTMTEGSVSSDTVSNTLDLHLVVSEGGVSSDVNINNIIGYPSLTEGGVSGDSNTVNANLFVTLSEGGVSGNVFFVSGNSVLVTVDEGAVSGDALTNALTFFDTMTEGSVSGDAVSNTLDLNLTVSDGVISSDAVINNIIGYPSLTEGSISSDSSSGTIITSATISEGIISSDIFFVSGNSILVTVSEGAVSSDSISNIKEIFSIVEDIILSSDTTVNYKELNLSVVDSSIVSDSFTLNLIVYPTVVEGSVVSDTEITLVIVTGIVAETMVISDVYNVYGALPDGYFVTFEVHILSDHKTVVELSSEYDTFVQLFSEYKTTVRTE